jgi:hypothetical protein
MLWYKSWRETRIKFFVSLGFTCLILLVNHKITGLPNGMKLSTLRGVVSMWNAIFVANACVWLAGAGIVTQPAFQATKGTHGSTLYTLSLPVSRLRLLMVRASLGWLLMAVSVSVFCSGLWAVSPLVRSLIRPAAMLEQIGTLIACGSQLYFLSVVLATFLEDSWRIMGSFLAFGLLGWMAMESNLPAFADIFRAVGKSSPLLAHTVPWSAIGFSLGLSAVLLLVALKIVRVREY